MRGVCGPDVGETQKEGGRGREGGSFVVGFVFREEEEEVWTKMCSVEIYKLLHTSASSSSSPFLSWAIFTKGRLRWADKQRDRRIDTAPIG